jgi:hypothetical protein
MSESLVAIILGIIFLPIFSILCWEWRKAILEQNKEQFVIDVKDVIYDWDKCQLGRHALDTRIYKLEQQLKKDTPQ